MKKYLSIICAIAMLASLTGCGSSDSDSESKSKSSEISASETEEKTEKETEKEEATPEQGTTEAATEKPTEAPTEEQTEPASSNLSIVSHSLTKDYSGADVLVIEYAWTNDEDKEEAFYSNVRDSVYQNGVECDDDVFGVDEINTEMHIADIQPGVTQRIVVGYHIKDHSPVTLKATRAFGSKEYLNKTVEIG